VPAASSNSMAGRMAATLFVAALVVCSGYAALFIAPEEATMGLIQRIFYFHVAAWASMFSAFYVTVFANIAYLATRKQKWDWLGVASAEVGVVCCTIGLVTGPIWAHPVWGVWWTWDARLVTTFILWLLYISYLLLRGLVEEPERRAMLSAVYGIFAFLDVPLVYVSNRLWRTTHPQPVILGGENSGLDPTMSKVLGFCIVAILGVVLLVLLDRYRLEKIRHEFDELRFEFESRIESESRVTDSQFSPRKARP
jgi:heme exporter protein C